MTREEAIEKLEQRVSVMNFVNDIYADSVDGEALEMAIEALKQSKETTEVKRGKWENVYTRNNVRYNMATMRCSICNYWTSRVYNYGNPVENVNYCPYCGAKMDTNENYDSEENDNNV